MGVIKPHDGCNHDGAHRHVTDVPTSGDIGELLMGTAVTLCCGSYVTIFSDDASVYCKCCFDAPPIGWADEVPA